jgi:hypothetical protein
MFMTNWPGTWRRFLRAFSEELGSLVASGFLLRRQDGRRVYLKENTESRVPGTQRAGRED